MKKLFLLLLTVFALSLCASAQTRTVKGTVLDAENDEPLIGVSVSAGTGYGVATDVDGQFTLAVPASATHLTVSYVGYETQEVAIKSGDMVIRLTSATSLLDPVIVVAYGEQKKSSFTGSAATVGSASIEKTQVTNVLDALNGKVAGLQLSNASGAPGSSSPTIRIRGFSSINAGNSPLVIVDGTPYGNDLNTLNTNDIESMTVLKDAASNALYGARGANGVILITTKRAKLGEATVTVDAKWGANMRASQDYDYIKNPAMYYETYYKALYNYAVDPVKMVTQPGGSQANVGGLGYTPGEAAVWANNNLTADNTFGLGYNVYTVPAGEMLIGTNGKLNPAATLGRMINYKGADYWLMPDNWMDETYKHSLRQEYNINITQGTEKSNFFASVGFLKNDGIVVTKSDYQRFSARINADVQAKSWLKVGANVSYSHFSMNSQDGEEGSSSSTSNMFAAATGIAPIYPLYIRNGKKDIMYDEYGNIRFDYGNKDNGGLIRPIFGDSNALGAEMLNKSFSEGNNFSGTGFFEIRFLKDFKFTSNNSMTLQEVRSTSVTNPYYGQYAEMNGMVGKQHNRTFYTTYQQLLTWTHNFNMVHNVNLLAGHEYFHNTGYVLSAQKHSMFDPDNDELAGAIINDSGTSYTTKYNNEGWLFRAMYDYDSRYFGSVSYRRDASSRFHPKHRWGNFWSLGGAWILSKESWFDAHWVDLLKIKASYGEQGNDNIGNFLYTNTYEIVNSNGAPAAVPTTMGNEDITWEKGGNLNAGVEFEFFGGRFNGGVEAFWRKTSDMLMYFPLPASYGFSGYYDNIGDMTNTGVEIELMGTPIRTRDFSWTINANLTWYKNKISYLPSEHKGDTGYIIDAENGSRGEAVKGYASGGLFYGEGQPMYTFYQRKYAGVDPETGQSLFYKNAYTKNEAGEPVATGGLETTTEYSEADFYLVGTALAPVYGGFSTQLEYKGFDLSVAFNYQIGGLVQDNGYAGLMGSPTQQSRGGNIHADILNAWTPENKNSNIPRFQFGDLYTASTSTRFLVDGSYLSLENINFGYTLPNDIVRKMYLSKLRVYFACDNIWVWSKRQGLDPRQSFTGGSNNTYYAPIRAISGGLTVTF